MFETVHLQPVGLIDDDEGGRVGDLLLASLVVLVSLKIDGVDSRPITGRASWSFEDLAPPCLVTKPDRFQHSMGFPLDWPHSNASQLLSCSAQVQSDEGVLTTSAVYRTVSNMMEGIVASFHRS